MPFRPNWYWSPVTRSAREDSIRGFSVASKRHLHKNRVRKHFLQNGLLISNTHNNHSHTGGIESSGAYRSFYEFLTTSWAPPKVSNIWNINWVSRVEQRVTTPITLMSHLHSSSSWITQINPASSFPTSTAAFHVHLPSFLYRQYSFILPPSWSVALAQGLHAFDTRTYVNNPSTYRTWDIH